MRSPSTRDLIALRCRQDADRVAFVEGRSGRSVTWSQIGGAAASWTGQLGALGRPRPARVGFLLTDPLAAATATIAGLAAGVTVAPLDPQSPGPAVAAAIRHLGLSAIVTDDGERTIAVAEVVDAESIQLWAVSDGRLRLEHVGQRAATKAGGEAPALIMTSSGTTGPPKIVPLTERQLLHTARTIVEHHRLSGTDRGYCPLPLFHINALVVGVLSTLVAGGTLVLDERFSLRRFWTTVDDHRVTWLNLVPAIIGLLADASPPPPAVQQRVRFARSASAELAPATLARFETHCGIQVLETYGMTEAASQIAANPLDRARRRPGSVGLPVTTDTRVVDDDGRPVPAGTVGTVQIRGESVITHYWVHSADRTVAVPARPAAGWLSTGDLGWFDGDGFLYLAGRADDIINRGGEKVYPGEIESVLLADPRVTAAAAVGRPHPVMGEEPVAFVVAQVTHRGRAGLGDELLRRCAQNLARSKQPVAIVLAETLPSGPTGKIRRSDVRRLATHPAMAGPLPPCSNQPAEELR